ncbi:MAG TPA: carboxypeptidase-like regulatory domain-containing protein, partial [Longimicrobiales bacterium]|nr:carboxypeptidase-like regulatory domain-containing protein [Longimicrobiales bacterium]
ATSSDWDGRFRFGPLAAARYTLRATRIGYADATVENVRVMLDSVTRIDVELAADAVRIDGVDVNVRRGPDIQHLATYEGLYTRRGEKRWANVVGTNRVWVHSDFAHVSTKTARQYIFENAPPTLGRGGVLSGASSVRPGPRRLMCQPMFSLRGALPMPSFVAEAYLSQPVDDFEGIEIFGYTWEAPASMRPDVHSSCGMIVFWPKRKPGER